MSDKLFSGIVLSLMLISLVSAVSIDNEKIPLVRTPISSGGGISYINMSSINESDPLWTANSSNVCYLNADNQLTGQNVFSGDFTYFDKTISVKDSFGRIVFGYDAINPLYMRTNGASSFEWVWYDWGFEGAVNNVSWDIKAPENTNPDNWLLVDWTDNSNFKSRLILTELQVNKLLENGVRVCLANGTNCPTSSINDSNYAKKNESNFFYEVQTINKTLIVRRLQGINRTTSTINYIINGTAFPDNNLQTGWFNMSNNINLYHFNNSANDSSNRRLNLTLYGATSYYGGVLNNSIGFTNYATSYAKQTSTTVPQNSSFSFWLYLNSSDTGGEVFGFKTAGQDSGQFLFWAGSQSGGQYQFRVQHGASTQSPVNYTTINEWHHFTIVNNNTHHYIYLDGNLVQDYNGHLITTSAYLCFGCWDSTGTGNAQYKMDEFAIFNKSLSASDVLNIYNTQKPTQNITSGTSSITDIDATNTYINGGYWNGSKVPNATYSDTSGTSTYSTSSGTSSYSSSAGYCDEAGYSYGGNADNSNYDFYVYNDLYVTNKIYSTGGYDPPYVLFDKLTQAQALKRIKFEIPIDKYQGLAIWWNGTNLMGITSQDNGTTAKIYTIPMTLVNTVNIPQSNVSYNVKYYFDSIDGTVKQTTSLNQDVKSIRDGIKLNQTSGKFYNISSGAIVNNSYAIVTRRTQ